MNKFFVTLATIATIVLSALTFTSAPALARNEVVNAWFSNCTSLDNTYSGVGDANWRCVVPDGSNRIMHFEKCWSGDQGYACKYEVVVLEDKSFDVVVAPTSNMTVEVEVSASANGGFYESGWSGTFDVKANGDGTFTATKNGNPMGTFGNCDMNGDGHAGRGAYCEDKSWISN